MRDVGNREDNRPIGVFDSGVGGLGILRELKLLLPNENFVYLADQMYLPYGEKGIKELTKRVYKISDYFLHEHNVKMMVVACNTVTANMISGLRKKYDFPIVGTVPAVKVAAQKTKTGSIAVISTLQTSKSKALKKLIRNHCKNIKTLNISSSGLVERVDNGELKGEKINGLLQKYLKYVVSSNADHLVLGCTHYSFLNNSIKKFIRRPIKLVDGNAAIARQTRNLLRRYSLDKRLKKNGRTIFLSTGDAKKFTKVAVKLMKRKITAENVKL